MVINITRDFCNATQHYYSLELLPFMIESQHRLNEGIKSKLDEVIKTIKVDVEKQSSKKIQRLNQMTPAEVEDRKEKERDALTTEKNFLESQMEASEGIIEAIKKQTSSTVLEHRRQRKAFLKWEEEGDEEGPSEKRKANSTMIEEYDRIFSELKKRQPNKEAFADIQNRNDAGNLRFHLGLWEAAEQLWDQALAIIFQKDHPLQNFP